MDPQRQEIEDNAKLFAQIDAYPWHTDHEFQGGLQAILGNAASAPQIEALTLRARCFYFSRKNNNIPIDFEAYKSHYNSAEAQSSRAFAATQSSEKSPSPQILNSTPSSEITPIPTTDANPQYPQTFSHLVSLIQSGAPIPGIKEIPPTVLSDQATASTASKRRKPWEIADETAKEITDVADTVKKQEGTFGDHRDEVIVQEFPDA